MNSKPDNRSGINHFLFILLSSGPSQCPYQLVAIRFTRIHRQNFSEFLFIPHRGFFKKKSGPVGGHFLFGKSKNCQSERFWTQLSLQKIMLHQSTTRLRLNRMAPVLTWRFSFWLQSITPRMDDSLLAG
jgi:hypothetical protein